MRSDLFYFHLQFTSCSQKLLPFCEIFIVMPLYNVCNHRPRETGGGKLAPGRKQLQLVSPPSLLPLEEREWKDQIDTTGALGGGGCFRSEKESPLGEEMRY